MKLPLTLRMFTPVAALSAMALLAGCEDRVSYNDLESAQEAEREEAEETRETRDEVNADLREQQREVDHARHEALKPNLDPAEREDAVEQLRKEQQEAEEIREEGAQEIREEARDAAEAGREADLTEQKLAAQRERDSYVGQVETEVSKAEARIETMETQVESLDGAEKETLQTRIDTIQSDLDRVEERLDELKAAEILDWTAHKEAVDAAVQDLNANLGDAPADGLNLDVDVDF